MSAFYKFVNTTILLVAFLVSFTPVHAQEWLTPNISAPRNGTENESLNPIVMWSSQAGVLYTVQVSEKPEFSSFIISTSYKAESGTSQIMLSGLDYLTTYYVRIRMNVGAQHGTWSSAIHFTTLEGPSTTPKPLSPVDGAINQSTRPTLKWHAMEDVYAYDVEVSPTTEFSSVSFTKDAISETEIITSLLSPTLTYFWHVRPHLANATGDWSSISSFRTGEAPYSPTLVLPEHDAQWRDQRVNFSWQAVPGASSYHLQVSTSSTFDNLLVDTRDITATSFNTTLSANQLVFWRVSAVNTIGEGTWSVWRSMRLETAAANVADITELQDFVMHPNPVSNFATFSFTVPSAGMVRFSITDLSGTEVLSATEPMLNVGSYSIPVDISALNLGVYGFNVSYNNTHKSGKLVIIR